MGYYREQSIHVNKKVKVVLHVSNYVTRKELEDVTCADTSNFAGVGNFIALKAEVYKLDINKVANFPSSLNNLKTK